MRFGKVLKAGRSRSVVSINVFNLLNTNVPITYSWQNGTPGTPTSGSCLSTTLRVFGTENPEQQGIWLDGMTPTACDRNDELFAVCEIF